MDRIFSIKKLCCCGYLKPNLCMKLRSTISLRVFFSNILEIIGEEKLIVSCAWRWSLSKSGLDFLLRGSPGNIPEKLYYEFATETVWEQFKLCIILIIWKVTCKLREQNFIGRLWENLGIMKSTRRKFSLDGNWKPCRNYYVFLQRWQIK